MFFELKNVNSFYGDSHILFDVNIEVPEGEIVCLLGRNGVGKSTTLKSIIGQLNSKNKSRVTGSILFDGREINRMRPYKIANLGIAYIPQGRKIFPLLSTKENLLLAEKKPPKGADLSKYWTIPRVYELFPRLKEREDVKGNLLSGGEQQMLTIARGLLQNPRLLLMDEITEGLASQVVDELVEVISYLKGEKVSILLAEQNVRFAEKLSDNCYFLEKGQVAYHNESGDIPSDVIQKFLGV